MNTTYRFRNATTQDIPTLVQMLNDDALGSQRENPNNLDAYTRAMEIIEQDPHNQILLIESSEPESRVCGMLQLSYLPSLTYQGAWRGQIEGVRIHHDFRRKGLGRLLIQHAIDCARDWGCFMVQLTTDKQRPDSLRFYESLGFIASHEGCKLKFAVAVDG